MTEMVQPAESASLSQLHPRAAGLNVNVRQLVCFVWFDQKVSPSNLDDYKGLELLDRYGER